MSYHVCIETDEHGGVFLRSGVLGRIPVPAEHAARIVQADAAFRAKVQDVQSALYEAQDIGKAEALIDEMARCWGPEETKIRSLQWELMEYAAEE